jgi:hypothetical protein
MYGYDHWQIALQITDPSFRQRGRPKTKSKVIVRQKKGKRQIWSWVPKWCPTPRWIGRLTVGHNINSTHICLVDILRTYVCPCSTIWTCRLGYHKIGYTLTSGIRNWFPRTDTGQRRQNQIKNHEKGERLDIYSADKNKTEYIMAVLTCIKNKWRKTSQTDSEIKVTQWDWSTRLLKNRCAPTLQSTGSLHLQYY